MSILRLITIGFMVMVTPASSTESPETPEMKIKKMKVKTLEDASKFMVGEFENACQSNIDYITKNFKPALEKPEGYGNDVQYYTNKDKIGLINNLNKLLKDASGKVEIKINEFKEKVQIKVKELEGLEKKEESLYSAQEISENLRDIYGILNEARKNCSLGLSQIEKQELKTKTLKERQNVLKKNQEDLKESQEALKACQTILDQKKPSMLSQAKNLLGSGKKKTEDAVSAPPTQKKKIGPDEKQRILIESLQKSGLM